jgi:hypothetical protein
MHLTVKPAAHYLRHVIVGTCEVQHGTFPAEIVTKRPQGCTLSTLVYPEHIISLMSKPNWVNERVNYCGIICRSFKIKG